MTKYNRIFGSNPQTRDGDTIRENSIASKNRFVALREAEFVSPGFAA